MLPPIINGMQAENIEVYKSKGIEMVYLVKSDNSEYIALAERYKPDGDYISTYNNVDDYIKADYKKLKLKLDCNPRKLIRASHLKKACNTFTDYIMKHIDLEQSDRILVLGTEEFMYPAIKLAARLSEFVKCVRSHATSRSPIAVSKEEAYPLKSRYELKSLYDESRKTYIYDLQSYDKVLILTDADIREEGLKTLVAALKSKCNHIIYVVQWQ